jgi:ubiquinone/menaquinone biosynthesis C-methylase UbiE
MNKSDLESKIEKFWDKSPLCSLEIKHEPGSKEFYDEFDYLREEIESLDFAKRYYEFNRYQNQTILDVGCGNGYLLSKYAQAGANVTGIDITSKAIELTQQRFINLGLKANILKADAQSLPFDDQSFDCVTSVGVLHHVPDTQKAINEIHRVLKPGGQFISMFYHRNSAKFQFKFRILSLIKGRSKEQLANEFDGLENPKGSVFNRQELAKMLSKFEKLAFEVGYLDTSDLTLKKLAFLPNNLFSPLKSTLGWNLYCKATKAKVD